MGPAAIPTAIFRFIRAEQRFADAVNPNPARCAGRAPRIAVELQDIIPPGKSGSSEQSNDWAVIYLDAPEILPCGFALGERHPTPPIYRSPARANPCEWGVRSASSASG